MVFRNVLNTIRATFHTTPVLDTFRSDAKMCVDEVSNASHPKPAPAVST
jgi:hypothetical protein